MTSKIKNITRNLLVQLSLPALALFTAGSQPALAQNGGSSPDAPSGIQEKIVASTGTVTLSVDWDRFGGNKGTVAKQAPLQFQIAPGSFFSAVVFNDEFRAVESGALSLVPAKGTTAPDALKSSFKQLTLAKLPPGQPYELAVRDAQSGFVYFNVDRFEYRYQGGTRVLGLENARLLLSPEFAQQLGRSADAGTEAGALSMQASMYPIEILKVANGEVKEASMPATGSGTDAGTVPGPDVIVGDMDSMVQSASGSVGGRVGLAIATTSCNAGVVNLNWLQNPNNDHPIIPQNLYRMSGGATNTDRLEQIGQGWMKHAFTALTQNVCNYGCNGVGGPQLGSGCSDPYSTGLNGGQTGIGSRAWANPFTGFYPRNDSATPNNNHTGHTHDVTSHRVLVPVVDLDTTQNVGATYFGETQYVTPHEYAWCQSHPGECNMYNNVSYRRFTVSGTTNFSFSPAAATVRETPAIYAWTGATIKRFEPAPGTDGIGYIAFKVTGPVGGMWHYEYAVYNQNLDRGIQSFSIPLGCGINLTNTGFRAPPNHPGWANDGTLGSAGFSNTAWTPVQTTNAITWSTETFAQNQNANAIRWGTMYNFRFDSDRPPQAKSGTVTFFKTGAPIEVAIQAPSSPCTPFQLATVVSRKTHGAAGVFDVDMPVAGGGVESRGLNGDHTIVFTFSNNVVSGNASITAPSGGSVAGTSFSASTMTVNLTGVTDAQQVMVTVTGVTDSFGQTMPDTSVPVGFLTGDVNGDRAVNGGDALQTRSRAGQSTDATNYRYDVNVDGTVSAGDTLVVRGRSGNSL